MAASEGVTQVTPVLTVLRHLWLVDTETSTSQTSSTRCLFQRPSEQKDLLIIPLPHPLSRFVVETPRQGCLKETFVFVSLQYRLHLLSLKFVDWTSTYSSDLYSYVIADLFCHGVGVKLFVYFSWELWKLKCTKGQSNVQFFSVFSLRSDWAWLCRKLFWLKSDNVLY